MGSVEKASGGEGMAGHALHGHRRYAVFYAPEPGSALAAFGAAWLGWDAAAGAERPRPDVPGLPRAMAEITAAPRRYGFHGTLKAPFRLAAGVAPEDLDQAVADLAAGEPSSALPPLRLAALGPFLALVLSAPAPRLDAVAAACVTGLDRFRMAMEPEERARRAAGLTPAQARNLDRWGYPFVMDEFRFHLTLTGPLDAAARDATAAALEPVLTPILGESQSFESLCLFGEPLIGPFRLLRRHRLGG
jgi:putative phosphonate metabolism protein